MVLTLRRWLFRLRLWIAQRISLMHDDVCWVDLYEWSTGDRRWSNITWDCCDAAQSHQPLCWCGKKCNRNQDDHEAQRRLAEVKAAWSTPSAPVTADDL